VLEITNCWPSQYDIAQFDKPSDVITAIINEWGLSFGNERPDFTYLNYYDISWGKKYYGGDKYKTAMNDVCQSCMTSYSIDGVGAVNLYTDGPWSGSVMGTVDFNTAYNKNWTASYISATKQVIVNAAWNEEDRKYTVEYSSEEGTNTDGKVLEINASWMRDDTNTEAMANRVAFFRGVNRVAISFQVEGSLWREYNPRDAYIIANLPAAVPVSGSHWRLLGKTYSLSERLTTLTFESRKHGANWWIWGLSKWDGGDVWW